MIVEQDHKCPICKAEFRAEYNEHFGQSPVTLKTWTVFDPSRGHAVPDHEITPEGNVHVRGILCQQCNRGLGHFGDGDPEMLEAALQYIKDRSYNS